MRDPSEIFTKSGQPIVLVVSRAVFAAYFLTMLWALRSGANKFPDSNLHFVWFLYLVILYLFAEKLYSLFLRQGIDLSFAFPIVLAVYFLNFVSLLLDGQERLPTLNRAEHFAAFVLISYVVWIFFIRYLPQTVWVEHPYYTSILVMAVVAMAGVGNELVELLMDHLFGTQFVGKQYDTSLDLLMNTLGSGLFLAVRLILGSSAKKPSENK